MKKLWTDWTGAQRGSGFGMLGLLGLMVLAAPVAAQDVYSVQGRVADSDGSAIDGAMVVALALPDSVLTKFSLSDGGGQFTLTRVPAGDYLLQITMVGRETIRQPFTLTDQNLDAGTISLEVLAVDMDELVVSIEHVPFVNRRDTLAYNANAFVTRPNATVEELLARLPGIEVDSDGTIIAQGEQVQSVLVDGKEFFGSDPTIATRNLPADAVESIEVYDRESDMAEFTGIADGQEQRTINLQLRDDARRGYFGSVVGGLGGGLEPSAVIDAQPMGRTRYHETLNVNRFSPSTQLALLGGANNVNQAGFAWGQFVGGGGGRGGGGQFGGGRDDGFTETLSFGLNANHDFSDENWLRTSYFFTGLDNVQRQETLQQQLLGSSFAALQESASDQTTDNKTHRLNVNAQYEFSDGHDVRLRGNLNGGNSTGTTLETNSSETLEGVSQNSGSSTNIVNSDDFGASGSLTWRKRLGEGGRSLVATASAEIEDPESIRDLSSTTLVRDGSGALVPLDILQEQTDTERNRELEQRLAFIQPIGGARVEIFAERHSVDEDGARSVLDLGSGTPVLNTTLSSGFDRTYAYNRGGLRFSRDSEKHRIILGLQAQTSNLESTIHERDETIESGFTHVLPSFDYRLQYDDAKTFRFRYTTRTREPSMTELQPFVDNSNPVRTYVGNPNLTPEYSHNFNTEYRFFDQFSFVNLFTYARFSYTDNEIIQSRVFDDRAFQTTMPVNIDHSWSANAGVTYGRPVRPLGASVNVQYGVSHTRGVELLNELQNNSRVWQNSLDVSLKNRDKEIFEIRGGARFSFSDVAYTLNDELNQGYLDKSFYANGTLHYGNAWTLRSQLAWSLYDEDVFGAGDRNVAMLQASISRMAMNDRVEIELVAFDILDQNKGVTYTNGSSFISERRAETLGQYIMLRMNYRLGSLGMGGGDRGRGGGFRGRR